MFTVEQIQSAHSKVKSGADFPAYIREIKQLGVSRYETFVSDGHTEFSGANSFTTTGPAKHAALAVAETPDTEQFKADLKEHQQGKTSFQTFIQGCAKRGIEKWIVRLDEMTCTYYDKSGSIVLIEKIPV